MRFGFHRHFERRRRNIDSEVGPQRDAVHAHDGVALDAVHVLVEAQINGKVGDIGVVARLPATVTRILLRELAGVDDVRLEGDDIDGVQTGGGFVLVVHLGICRITTVGLRCAIPTYETGALPGNQRGPIPSQAARRKGRTGVSYGDNFVVHKMKPNDLWCGFLFKMTPDDFAYIFVQGFSSIGLRKNRFAKRACIPPSLGGLLYQKNDLIHRNPPFTPKWILTQSRLRNGLFTPK